jgi:hypothetical protein
MAIAWILLDLLERAKPIPGLAPKRPRGRPRKSEVNRPSVRPSSGSSSLLRRTYPMDA